MKTINFVILFFLCTGYLITSCSAQPTIIPTNTLSSFSFDIPIPENGKAIITGTLLNSTTNKPISGVPYLARALNTDNPDIPITISFSFQNDPGALYDNKTGDFIFKNIEPRDNYVIFIIFGPGNTEVVKNSETELPIIISVSSGEFLDLGEVKISEP
jgi:hypothetical protein